MKIPKKIKRYCKHCKKYIEHSIRLSKNTGRSKAHPLSKWGPSRLRSRGRRRGFGNFGRYSKPPKPKMTGSKTSKKVDMRYTCSQCKKISVQSQGFRTRKAVFE